MVGEQPRRQFRATLKLVLLAAARNAPASALSSNPSFLPCVCGAAARLNPEPAQTSSLAAATGPLQQIGKIASYGEADLGRMA